MRSLTRLFFCILGVAIISVTAIAWAEVTPTEFNSIVFNDGKYDGKFPSSADLVVRAVREIEPKATFGFREGNLLVGLPGTKLSVKHDSDCPVNSQFSLAQEAIAANHKELVKLTLTAWTQARHKGFERAELDRYNETETHAEVVLKVPKAGNSIQR